MYYKYHSEKWFKSVKKKYLKKHKKYEYDLMFKNNIPFPKSYTDLAAGNAKKIFDCFHFSFGVYRENKIPLMKNLRFSCTKVINRVLWLSNSCHFMYWKWKHVLHTLLKYLGAISSIWIIELGKGLNGCSRGVDYFNGGACRGLKETFYDYFFGSMYILNKYVYFKRYY